MKVQFSVILGALLLSSLPTLGAQQAQTFSVDPAHSEVHFTLPDPVHTVHGSFKVQSGSLHLTSATGAMSGRIVVDAGSGDSGNATRDKKMTNDQLLVSRYTSVSFDPKHFTGTLDAKGDSTITVNGTFQLIGKTHEISVPMKVHIDGAQYTAAGSFVIPFVDWGVKDPSNFLMRVGKEVTIDLSLAGTVAQQ